MTRVSAALEGNLKAYMARETAAVVRGVTSAVAVQTAKTQADVRRLVDAALPARGRSGRRVSNAIRSLVFKVDPSKPGDRPAGVVYSKLGRREGGEFVDYLLPHVKGMTLRPRVGGAGDKGKFMILPVRGVSRRVSAIKRDLSQLGIDPQLALIKTRGGKYLFVRRPRELKRGGFSARARTTLLAILVPSVTLTRRLDVAPAEQAALAGLADGLLAALNSES